MRIFTIIFCLFLSVHAMGQTRDTLYTDAHKKLVLKNGDKRVYIEVDGKVYNGRLESIDTSKISSIDVFKPADAVTLYGPRAINGAILVTTKKKAVEPDSSGANFLPKDAPIPRKTRILLVIDGKKMYKFPSKETMPDASTILSVDVLKPNEAKRRYGKLGENGAVIIKTKNVIIPLYEKKLSALSQEYKDYMAVHDHNDAEVYYVINGEVFYEQPVELNNKLTKLSSREIKSIEFYDKWTSDLGNAHPTLIIKIK